MMRMTDHRPRRTSKQRKLAESGTLNPHPEAVSDALFQDKAFFDPCDLLQIKYEMLRRAELDSSSVTASAQAFGFSRRHFYEIRRHFSEHGLLGLLSEKRGPKSAHKLDNLVMTFIGTAQDADPSVNASALVALIKRKFKLTVHPRSIERALERKKKLPPG
jgi:transposase